MLGVLVNTAAVLAGGTLGLLLKRGIPEKISDTLMKGIALAYLPGVVMFLPNLFG